MRKNRVLPHIEVRPGCPEALILDSAIRHLAAHGEEPSRVRRILTRLMRDPSATVLVASPVGHHDDYLGWAMAIDGGLIYVWVREVVRMEGIGGHLLATARPDGGRIPCAFWTSSAGRLAAGGFPWYYDFDFRNTVLKFAR